jgi:hypothetical protein
MDRLKLVTARSARGSSNIYKFDGQVSSTSFTNQAVTVSDELLRRAHFVFINQVAGPVRGIENPDWSAIYNEDGGFEQRKKGPDVLTPLIDTSLAKKYFLANNIWRIGLKPLIKRDDFSESKGQRRQLNASDNRVTAKANPPRRKRRRKLKKERVGALNAAHQAAATSSHVTPRDPMREFVIHERHALAGEDRNGPTSFFVVSSK